MSFNRTTYNLPLVFNALAQDDKVLEEPPLGFCVLSHTYHTLSARTILPAFRTEEFLGLGFNFGTSMHYQINGIAGTLRANQFNLAYIPECVCEYTLEKGTHFLFTIHFSRQYLQLMERFFSEQLKELLHHADRKTMFALSLDHFKCDEQIILKIKTLLEMDMPAGLARNTYLNCKVFDILLYCLEKLRHIPGNREAILNRRDLETVVKVKKYLTDNYQHKQSVDLVSDIVDVDRHKLRKDFKKAYKVTMLEYVINLRMEKAIALLRDTKMRIGEVAESVGYKPEHFSEVFKKRFGFPPRDLRNQGNAEEEEA